MSGSGREALRKKIKLRLTGLYLVFVFLAGGVLFRAAVLQVLPNQRLSQLAQRQFKSRLLIRPNRGLILDRNGEALAINQETKSLAAKPSKIRNKEKIARLLHLALGIPRQQLLKRLQEKKDFVWIKRHLSEQTIEKFRKIGLMEAESRDLVDGLWLIKESKRIYPHRDLAAQVIGGVDVDSDGIEGVELWMNEALRGQVVSVSAIRDALGRPTFIDADAAKGVQDGKNTTLTLDSSLQFSVEQKLKEALEKTQAKSGSVVVMDAENGEIYAIANAPSFDPNIRGSSLDARRNRALTDGYEPGSTLKPILVATALKKGMKLTDTVWGGNGAVQIQGHTISEAETHEKFDWINLKKLIAVSSNVGSARLALQLGAESLVGAYRLFGFGQKTGTGFPGEIGGWFPTDPKKVPPLSLANLAFGQGAVATLLQVVRSYAVFLNGGWLVQPSLVRNSSNPGEPTPIPFVPAQRVLSPKISQQVLETLAAVTEEGGTGTKAQVDGYQVAGKTGTAQMVDPATKKYSNQRYYASFVGFALDTQPKIVIGVGLDSPQGVYYAGQTAAPLFREVFSAVATRFSIPPKKDWTSVIAERNPKKDPSRVIEEKVEKVEFKPQLAANGKMTHVADLRGMSIRQVLALLEGYNLSIQISGHGVVVDQVPSPGDLLVEPSRVIVKLK